MHYFIVVLIAFALSMYGCEGKTGPAGPSGSTGTAGPAGPAGPQGSTGPAGPAGPQGPAGADGADGAAGPQGEKGDTGETGPAGADGADGAAGPQGEKGDTGETGPAGPQGEKGDTGETGPAGPQGPAGADGEGVGIPPGLVQLDKIEIRKEGADKAASSPLYLFVEDEMQLVAVGLTQSKVEIPVEVTWTVKDDNVTIEDGLVTAELKGSTTIYATNDIRGIRGELKIVVQKSVDKVVVYDGYADDGTAAMQEEEEYADRKGGAQDSGTFSTEVKGSKHRAYAIAYDDEDDMLHAIDFEWESTTDNATIKPVKVVAAPKALKTDGSESRSNPGNFKVQITVNGSAKITAIGGGEESDEVSVGAFTPVSTVRMLEVDQTDLPIAFAYSATSDETADANSDEVSVSYFRIIPDASEDAGADDEVREAVVGDVTFTEVGGGGLLTFYNVGGDEATREKGGAIETSSEGEATLRFGGAVPDADLTANTVYAMVKETEMKNHVTYVQVSAGFAGAKVIKVTINPE